MCTRQLARCPSLVMETRGMATRSTSSAQCGAMRQQALQVWRQAQLCGVIQHGKSCHVHHMTYGKASSPHRVLHTVTHTTHASFPPHCPCIPCHHPLNLTPPGILIEDQLWPKSCGHVRGKRVAPRDEALARIRAAVDARCGARTLHTGVWGASLPHIPRACVLVRLCPATSHHW
jgi:hypothetical protein